MRGLENWLIHESAGIKSAVPGIINGLWAKGYYTDTQRVLESYTETI